MKEAIKRKGVILTKAEEGLFNRYNKAFVRGEIGAEFEFFNQILDERLFETVVTVPRRSGMDDMVQIIVSENIIGKETIKSENIGMHVDVAGEFLSCKRIGEDGKKHLKLFLFARAIKFYGKEKTLPPIPTNNLLYLSGYICKKTIYRKSPLGKDIAEFIIGFENKIFKSYSTIPCISFGDEALKAKTFENGNIIQLYGRMQSREYFKKFSENSGDGEMRKAFEVCTIIARKK